MGERLYDFLSFCKQELPANATFQLIGFGEKSFEEVAARYFLSPLLTNNEAGEFKIIYGANASSFPGYAEYARDGDLGRILIRRGKPL